MALTDYACRAILAKSLDDTPLSNQLMSLAYQFDSELPAGKSEDLSFLGAIGVIKEWIIGRNISQPKEYDFALKNVKFSGGVRLPLDWINNDKRGQVASKFSDLGMRRNQFWSRRLAALINGASTNTRTLDAASYFGATHSAYSVFNNDISRAGVTSGQPTPLEAAQAIYAAYVSMLGFLDDQGEPANEGITNIAVTCGIDVAGAVMQGVNDQLLNTGAAIKDNPLAGLKAAGLTVSVIATPRITTAGKMQIWNTSPNAKPLLLQRNSSEFRIQAMAAGSEMEYTNDAWEYAIKEVGEVGFGRPWEAIQLTFT